MPCQAHKWSVVVCSTHDLPNVDGWVYWVSNIHDNVSPQQMPATRQHIKLNFRACSPITEIIVWMSGSKASNIRCCIPPMGTQVNTVEVSQFSYGCKGCFGCLCTIWCQTVIDLVAGIQNCSTIQIRTHRGRGGCSIWNLQQTVPALNTWSDKSMHSKCEPAIPSAPWKTMCTSLSLPPCK